MIIQVILTTNDGEIEKDVEVKEGTTLTSQLFQIATKYHASGIEAYHNGEQVAVLDIGKS